MNASYAEKSIDWLDITLRARNALLRAGVDNVGKLTDLTPGQLLRTEGIGAGSLNSIKAAIANMGLSLRRP